MSLLKLNNDNHEGYILALIKILQGNFEILTIQQNKNELIRIM